MTESDILFQLFSYNWPSFEELVEYANKRHGYVGDDGYYGVTYPSDLDEYQKEIEGEFIPEGFVEVMYWDAQRTEGTRNRLHISPEGVFDESRQGQVGLGIG